LKQINKAVDLTDLAIGILVLGIVVTIGASILITTRDARLTDLSTVTTANESLTTVTESGETLTNVWVQSVDACINQTDSTVIPTSNWTSSISTLNGKATVSYLGGAGSGFNNTNWNCTYTWYNTSRADWAVADDAATGIAEYGNWFTTIVVVGVASLILALIFMSFGRSARTVSGGSY